MNSKYLNILFILISSLFISNLWFSKMSFGYGLGDVLYFGLLGVFEFIMIVLGIAFHVEKRSFRTLNWIWLIVLIWTFLHLTIYRGHEKSWDGHIFI